MCIYVCIYIYMWKYGYRLLDKFSLPSKNVYYCPPNISPPNSISWRLLHRISQKCSSLLLPAHLLCGRTLFRRRPLSARMSGAPVSSTQGTEAELTHQTVTQGLEAHLYFLFRGYQINQIRNNIKHILNWFLDIGTRCLLCSVVHHQNSSPKTTVT